jgi:hypothetical protein
LRGLQGDAGRDFRVKFLTIPDFGEGMVATGVELSAPILEVLSQQTLNGAESSALRKPCPCPDGAVERRKPLNRAIETSTPKSGMVSEVQECAASNTSPRWSERFSEMVLHVGFFFFFGSFNLRR